MPTDSLTFCDVAASIMRLDPTGSISGDRALEIAEYLDAADGRTDRMVDLRTQDDMEQTSRIVRSELPEAIAQPVFNGLVALFKSRPQALPSEETIAKDAALPPLEEASAFMVLSIAWVELQKTAASANASPEMRLLAQRVLNHLNTVDEFTPRSPLEQYHENHHLFDSPVYQALRSGGELRASVKQQLARFDALGPKLMEINRKIAQGTPVSPKDMEVLFEAEHASTSLGLFVRQTPPPMSQFQIVSTAEIQKALREIKQSSSGLQVMAQRLGPYGKPIALVAGGILIGAGLLYGYQQLSK